MRLIFFLLLSCQFLFAKEEIIYLTCHSDPSSAMTVVWQTKKEKAPQQIFYKRACDKIWMQKICNSKRLDYSNVTLHHVELTHLKPDEEYTFYFSKKKIYRFATLPKEGRPLKIVIGGDAYQSKAINQKMNTQVAKQNPDLVVMAGDIAYTEGLTSALRTRFWKIHRWQQFFKMWAKQMVTAEGRLIPIVATIGNHDILEGFEHPEKKEVLFYEFFVFPKPASSYRLLKLAHHTCLYLLDSGHTVPVGGRQTEWLEKSFQDNKLASYQIPIYHIAAYPTETAYTHRGARDIRKFWSPLFEKYGVKVSMEHDNHTFKRTFPIKADMVDKEGVLYLGDGSWGVTPCKPTRNWYLAKALQTNCYWLLTISKEKCELKALDEEGVVLDELEIAPPR